MKVKSLKITSFRGIRDLTLKFNDNEPNVLIGVNGAGKTSILDCLAILLSWLIAGIEFDPSKHISIEMPQGLPATYQEQNMADGQSFSEQDITNGHSKTNNEITISIDSQEVRWFISTTRIGQRININKDISKLKQITDQIRQEWKKNHLTAIPLVVYYPVNRAVLDIPLELREKNQFQQVDAYEKALGGLQISFASFFQWFRALEDLENEERRDKPDYRNHQLEAVRQAIYLLMPDFSNLRVRRSPLRMTVTKLSEELRVNQLSDGEKCLLAMVGDLARRLAIANPDLSTPREGSAVVLIDEIELHLHPAWQREIIPALTRTFPNCHFIVTTHSPQVISQVKPEGIYILKATPEGIVIRNPESSFGRDSNRILEDLMGVPERPQEIKELLLELFRLIDKGDLDAARQLRQKLVEEIGSDEPQFVKADVLMRRKEILKR